MASTLHGVEYHCRGRDAVNPNESQAVGNRGFNGSWERKETETNQVSDWREWELGQDNHWRAKANDTLAGRNGAEV